MNEHKKTRIIILISLIAVCVTVNVLSYDIQQMKNKPDQKKSICEMYKDTGVMVPHENLRDGKVTFFKVHLNCDDLKGGSGG